MNKLDVHAMSWGHSFAPHQTTQPQQFGKWLASLGYAHVTCYYLPLKLKEYLAFIGHRPAHPNPRTQLQAFWQHLKHRPKKRGPGRLSPSSLRGYVRMLNLYARFLHQSEQENLMVDLPKVSLNPTQRVILSPPEVEALFQATDSSPIGLRDRAMLSIYYGCGLRCREGIQLDLSDLSLHWLYVRHGKGQRERYLPLSPKVSQVMKHYLLHGRKHLACKKKDPALLLSQRGKRIGQKALYDRLQVLAERTGLGRRIGLHCLRHAIATHLLQQGLSMEDIQRFLGHQSMISTQIYTHLLP